MFSIEVSSPKGENWFLVMDEKNLGYYNGEWHPKFQPNLKKFYYLRCNLSYYGEF